MPQYVSLRLIRAEVGAGIPLIKVKTIFLSEMSSLWPAVISAFRASVMYLCSVLIVTDSSKRSVIPNTIKS